MCTSLRGHKKKGPNWKRWACPSPAPLVSPIGIPSGLSGSISEAPLHYNGALGSVAGPRGRGEGRSLVAGGGGWGHPTAMGVTSPCGIEWSAKVSVQPKTQDLTSSGTYKVSKFIITAGIHSTQPSTNRPGGEADETVPPMYNHEQQRARTGNTQKKKFFLRLRRQPSMWAQALDLPALRGAHRARGRSFRVFVSCTHRVATEACSGDRAHRSPPAASG